MAVVVETRHSVDGKLKRTWTKTTHCSTTTPSQHVWSSGVLCFGSDGMELASRLSPDFARSTDGSENSSFRNAIGTSSALEALRDALYKSTTSLLLLLLLINTYTSAFRWYRCTSLSICLLKASACSGLSDPSPSDGRQQTAQWLLMEELVQFTFLSGFHVISSTLMWIS